MTETKEHTHKLKRITYKSGNSTFFCVLDCRFKIAPQLALGKRCICWRCGNEFFLNEYALRLAKPHCDSCHKPKKGTIVGPFEEVVGPVLLEQNISLAKRLQQEIDQRSTQPEEEEL